MMKICVTIFSLVGLCFAFPRTGEDYQSINGIGERPITRVKIPAMTKLENEAIIKVGDQVITKLQNQTVTKVDDQAIPEVNKTIIEEKLAITETDETIMIEEGQAITEAEETIIEEGQAITEADETIIEEGQAITEADETIIIEEGQAINEQNVLVTPEKPQLLDGHQVIVEDDMRFELKMTRSGVRYKKNRWRGGKIPYTFSSTFRKRQNVRNAMNVIERKTDNCIQFVERKKERDYVKFINTQSSCWSYVGRTGGEQKISYPNWCVTSPGSAQHELIHAVGFVHEHSRTDRDKYIRINYNNVSPESMNNFLKFSKYKIDDFHVPYDYGSIMHYPSYAFSKNKRKTIVPLKKGANIGQRKGLSELDAEKIKRMYGCA